MRVVKETIGMFAANAYVVACEKTGRAAIIDCGETGGRLADVVRQNGWTLDRILLTHGHIDHAGGLTHLRRQFPGVRAAMHEADALFLESIVDQGRLFGVRVEPVKPVDDRLVEGDEIRIGEEIVLRVLETPGHSPGSVSFAASGADRVFSGDVLFAGSIGRTDLPGGDPGTLLRSIEEKLYPLGDATIVHAGHMEDTSVGAERRTNPFLNSTPDQWR